MQHVAGRQDHLIFIAEHAAEGQPFGVYDIKDIDYRNQLGEWGLFLEEKSIGNGIPALEAAVLLLDYAFGYLNLQKIVGNVLADNERAIRFDEGLGMQLEGVRKRHVFYDGGFHDLCHYAIFREDFYERPTPIGARMLKNIRSAAGQPDRGRSGFPA